MLRSTRPIVTSLKGLDDEYMLTAKDVASVMACSMASVIDMMVAGRIAGAFSLERRAMVTVGNLRRYLERQTIRNARGLRAAE